MPTRNPTRLRTLPLLLVCILLVTLLCPQGATALPSMPEFSAPSVLLVHLDSDTVIYSKDAALQRAPSSLVKLMTALVALEHIPDLSMELTASETAVSNLTGLATAGLRAGETMSAEHLLTCLLLPSAGDAANVLAEAVAGDVDSFVALMNQKAQQLGMTATNFVNPHGGDSDRQLTTATDMAILARVALKNQTITTICAGQYKRIPKTNLSTGDRYYFSNNALVISSEERRKTEDYYYAPAFGLMSGTSTDAGLNLVAVADRGGFRLLCVVLGAARDPETGAKHHYTDAVALFEWCYENLSYATLLQSLEPVHEVDIALSSAKDAMTLVSPTEYRAVIPTEVGVSGLQRSFQLQEVLEAPIQKGQVLGRVVFTHNGVEYGQAPLVAQSDADRSQLLFVLDRISNFTQGRWFKVAALAAAVLAALYLGLMWLVNKKHSRSRRKKSEQRNRRYR